MVLMSLIYGSMTTVRVSGFITSVVEICWNIRVLFLYYGAFVPIFN